MQESDDVFRTGRYHRSFTRRHTHVIRRLQLRLFYTTSVRLVRRLGWPDPLARRAPRILLCGSASPFTTLAFARFVRQRTLEAGIDVLDISPYVLDQSAQLLETCRDIEKVRISLVEGDALRMPFADATFDWIETDFFIQFFSAPDLAALFREWWRVLKPGGIVTTRDWLMQRHTLAERATVRAKNWLIRHILGPVAHNNSAADVQQRLRQLGLDSVVVPVRAPAIGLGIPAMCYLLIYKPPAQR